ncbi:flagellar biosynthesis protein FlgE, partial [Oleispira antarctica]
SLLGTGSQPVGSGVMVENVRQQFSQGNISGTENSLDMAIDGNGFFILEDRGSISYTRAGLFGLDKDGYVVANNNARVQGFDANSDGVVSGVLGDIQIQVGNQAPALTSRVSAILNLDAGEEVLQEQGLELTSNGLAIGVADSGIIASTTSTLVAAGQPATAGVPSQVTFGNTVTAMVGALPGATAVTIDYNDGSTPLVVNLDMAAAVPAITTNQQLLNYVQTELDAVLGSQQITARESVPGGFLEFVRAGFSATNGTNFTVTPAGLFGGTTPANGSSGSLLFVGSSPITADFRSIPGTSTTTRTTGTPPLGIVTSSAGSFAVLTADSIPAGVDLNVGNTLNFNVVVEGQAAIPITLDNTNPGGATPTLAAIAGEINTQIALAGAVRVVASDVGGKLVFTAQAPAVEGEFVQIQDLPSTGNSLSNLGFTTTFRDDGVDPVNANNIFDLSVTGTTPLGPLSIAIPPNNYASLDDLAVAIQQVISADIGAGGLSGEVTVAAVGGQLVFTNTSTGAGEGISMTATVTAPVSEGVNSLAALGFDSMFAVTGQNEVDKTNSFRLNLTVPAPDSDNRSGSVLISLDEDYRSVQQLATSINRQLNSQNGDDYIGIRAQAVEISPKVVPPQFTLELVATEEGEASIISISNVSASGPDVTAEELFAILQTNPADGSLLTTGIEGVNNQYPAQTATIVDPDGNETVVTTDEGMQANEIASIYNNQPGVTATANTVMTIPLSSYNNPGNTMSLTVNGQLLTSTTLPEMADEIISFRGTTLPGFTAEVNEAGDLMITNEIGLDVKVEINSASPTDSLVVLGALNTGPVVLGGTATAATAAAVGGHINFTLNEGYVMQAPVPVISGLFGALTEDEFTPVILNAFDPTDQNTYNHATSTTMYDSLGNDHVMTEYFVKEPLDPTRPNEANIWAMYVQIDGQDVGDPDSTLPFPENLVPTPARYELFFNQDGTLDTEATGDIFVTNWDPIDGAGDPTGAMTSLNVLEGGLPLTEPATNSNFEIILDGSTQFGSSFAVSEVNQNGYTTGRLAGLEVDQEGVIFARYTNGQAQVLGQVALANFRNPEGLTPLGDTGWAESFESGVATVGSPATASFGQVRASALEDSNVDISEELVGLIIAQRNFQASAKTIETMDQVTQTILNI